MIANLNRVDRHYKIDRNGHELCPMPLPHGFFVDSPFSSGLFHGGFTSAGFAFWMRL
jgi:hypothetical protein